jgi:hypothetical protein
MTADEISRELWWTNQEFFLSMEFHHASPCSYHRGMNSRLVGGRSSETWSHSIDMIIIIMVAM